ncbi:thioesterase family protein [Pseudanabaena sp. 'Roaring Creek']|uniref:acyl-CoA thioesterase n=1 Tax=Pseudanabaena sp. 'Roaring Creek' TaxID=1681830 RepID=UPI0006D770CC|nr:thioesterase family protein [Pseudanabaena sp. 'Roaring Creek']
MHKPFTYDRSIHFQDTDAAGVVYFANGLSLCHEAYEASLVMSGINLRAFFSGKEIAVPVTHASIDFFKPMFCGDRITIELTPTLLSPVSFQIAYQLLPDEVLFDEGVHGEGLEKKAIAKALTKHVCINPTTRTRCNLSSELLKWIETPSFERMD